jgi:hypothetical protein
LGKFFQPYKVRQHFGRFFSQTQLVLAHFQHLEALQMLGGGSGGLSNGGVPASSMASSGSSTIHRPKQPPPGFSLLNLTGIQQTPVPNLLSQGAFRKSLRAIERFEAADVYICTSRPSPLAIFVVDFKTLV